MTISKILSTCLFLGIAVSSHSQEIKDYYHIAIIDRFYPPMEAFEDDEDKHQHLWMYGVVDIDQDYHKEAYYHGDMVQLIANDPSFVFLRYPLAGQESPMREILKALNSINDRFERTPIDSLVLSWESSTLISAFETPLVREHRERYIDTIRQWGKTMPSWQDTYLVIKALESLTEKGAQVFTIAGNSGPRAVNTLSFAKGVTTVGAAEKELDYFISDNAFVDTYEQAAYRFKRLDDEHGNPIGYDVNGDGCEDIPVTALSSHDFSQLPKAHWPPIKGSSFAAPMALKKALIKQPRQCSESVRT